MDNKELKEYVLKCIKELAEEFKKDPDVYGYESHIHYDLYFLLNRNNPLFWEKRAIRPEEPLGNRQWIDLVVYNPDNNDEPKIAIEIKYGGAWATTKIPKSFDVLKDLLETKTERINAALCDILKLIIYNKPSIIKRIFLYFGDGDSKDLDGVKSTLRRCLKIAEGFKREIDCILVHTATPNILYNEDIIK